MTSERANIQLPTGSWN